MSYLATSATAVATAVTTTALVLPLLSWSPRKTLHQFLQGTVGGKNRTNASSLSSLSTSRDATDSSVTSGYQHAQEEFSLTDTSWMVEQFVDLLRSKVLCDGLPDHNRYCAFIAMLHAMNSAHMKEGKELLYEKTSVDVAMAEDDAKDLLQYFHFATWGCEMEEHRSPLLSCHKRSSVFQDHLRRMGHNVVQEQRTTDPGRASYFMSVNYAKREVVISISYVKQPGNCRKWIEKTITKATGGTIQSLQLSNCGDKQHQFAREELVGAARVISEAVFHMIEHLFIPYGFRVVVCGHSLGAGVASLLGVLWKDHCCARQLDLNLHVYAFGPPPCLSRRICDASTSYISTIINNSDCIPRLSATSLQSLESVLVLVDQRLKICSLSPKDMPYSSTEHR
jgi:hypothetical protein